MNQWPPATAPMSTDASVIETLADLLAAAGDAVLAVRRVPEHSCERASHIEACVASIYDQVESLLRSSPIERLHAIRRSARPIQSHKSLVPRKTAWR